jgi:hypothetical protein
MKDQECFSEAIIRNLQLFSPYTRTIIITTKKKNRRKATDMAIFFSWRYNPRWGLYFTAI